MAQAELGPAAGDAGLRAELCLLGEREAQGNERQLPIAPQWVSEQACF